MIYPKPSWWFSWFICGCDKISEIFKECWLFTLYLIYYYKLYIHHHELPNESWLQFQVYSWCVAGLDIEISARVSHHTDEIEKLLNDKIYKAFHYVLNINQQVQIFLPSTFWYFLLAKDWRSQKKITQKTLAIWQMGRVRYHTESTMYVTISTSKTRCIFPQQSYIRVR